MPSVHTFVMQVVPGSSLARATYFSSQPDMYGYVCHAVGTVCLFVFVVVVVFQATAMPITN